MKHLLIIYRQFNNAEAIRNDLEADGYGVHLIENKALDLKILNLSAYDLAIIQSYPDLSTAWGVYLNFKERFPDFPILLYIRQNTLDTLKASVKEVFREKAASARVRVNI